jgi:hypothetical protein
MTELQRRFYTMVRTYVRSLGFKGAICGSNFHTADSRLTGPLDKYSQCVLGAVDRHAYGDVNVTRPGNAPPLQTIHYIDHPHTISELYTGAQRRSAFAPACAAYGALNGLDAFYHFGMGTPHWLLRRGGFAIGTPDYFGQFPACAVLFRDRLVQEAPVVLHEALALSNLYHLRGAASVEPVELDELRQKDVPEDEAEAVAPPAAFDPLTFYVGRVTREVAENPGPSFQADLTSHIDRENKAVRSVTDEMAWDWGQGLIAINAPGARGAVGMLKDAGPIGLTNVVIESGNAYGSILLVALDSEPLETSERMLLQAFSEEVETDGPPICLKNLAGTVTLTRPDAESLTVTALDHNGYPRDDALPGGVTNTLSVALVPDCVYYVIESTP